MLKKIFFAFLLVSFAVLYAEGLATVAPAAIDKNGLAKTMKLPAEQKIILAQSIGYSK
jgi:hypothetical protein